MSLLPGKKRAEHAQPRWRNDWYVEPPTAVESLFRRVRFVGSVYDPACGSGTIPTIAAGIFNIDASGSDLVDRGFGYPGNIDFLTDHTRRQNIVTNPPYKHAEAFVAHALDVTDFKVAMVVPLPFLAGQKRYANLYSIKAPATILVLSKRPSMPPGGTSIPAKGGTTDYCWIIWDHDHDGEPRVVWTM